MRVRCSFIRGGDTSKYEKYLAALVLPDKINNDIKKILRECGQHITIPEETLPSLQLYDSLDASYFCAVTGSNKGTQVINLLKDGEAGFVLYMREYEDVDLLNLYFVVGNKTQVEDLQRKTRQMFSADIN